MDWLYRLSDRLNTYYRATDIPVCILGTDGTLMNSIGHENRSAASKNLCERDCPCAEIRALGCSEAGHLDQTFICPSARLFFSLPCAQNGRTRAVLLAGPIPEQSDPQKNRYLSKLLAAATDRIPGPEEAAVMRTAEERQKINDYFRLLMDDDFTFADATADEKRLIEDVISGDKEHAQKLLKKIISRIYSESGNDFNMIRMQAIDLTALLSRAIAEAGMDAENVYHVSERAMNEILLASDLTDFSIRMLEILDSFMSSAFAKYPQATSAAIRDAVIYISDHYSEDLSLQETAEHVSMNASYFSSLFKRIMGTSFSEYLTEKRIAQAKLLLRHGNTAIADIAAAVGYENQSYFSRVFKSKTGMSPNKYRHS